MAGLLVIVNMATYLVGWLNTHLCVYVCATCMHAYEYVFSCSNDVYVPFIGSALNYTFTNNKSYTQRWAYYIAMAVCIWSGTHS